MVIASSLDKVAAVGEAVRELCRCEGLTEEDAGLVELGIVETINNAIEHAYPEGAEGRIDLRMTVDEERVEVSVGDDAPAADPATFLPPEPRAFDPSDRSSLPEGGFGLAVVHRVFDEVRFARDGRWNRLTLIRKRVRIR